MIKWFSPDVSFYILKWIIHESRCSRGRCLRYYWTEDHLLTAHLLHKQGTLWPLPRKEPGIAPVQTAGAVIMRAPASCWTARGPISLITTLLNCLKCQHFHSLRLPQKKFFWGIMVSALDETVHHDESKGSLKLIYIKIKS